MGSGGRRFKSYRSDHAYLIKDNIINWMACGKVIM
nr:hypothetical protein B11C_110455 [Bartonella sp. 1-1C]